LNLKPLHSKPFIQNLIPLLHPKLPLNLNLSHTPRIRNQPDKSLRSILNLIILVKQTNMSIHSDGGILPVPIRHACCSCKP